MKNQMINYSKLSFAELLSLVALKFSPSELTAEDCATFARLHIDFDAVEKQDLLCAAMTRMPHRLAKEWWNDEKKFNSFMDALWSYRSKEEVVFEEKEDRTHRRINRKMARKHRATTPKWLTERIERKNKPNITKSIKLQNQQYRVLTLKREKQSTIKPTAYLDSRRKCIKHYEIQDIRDQLDFEK
jgi:hypothetical protein